MTRKTQCHLRFGVERHKVGTRQGTGRWAGLRGQLGWPISGSDRDMTMRTRGPMHDGWWSRRATLRNFTGETHLILDTVTKEQEMREWIQGEIRGCLSLGEKKKQRIHRWHYLHCQFMWKKPKKCSIIRTMENRVRPTPLLVTLGSAEPHGPARPSPPGNS